MNVITVLKGVYLIVLFLFLIIFILLTKTPDLASVPLAKTVSYGDIEEELQTGDIICFCGSFVEHFFVRFFMDCPISHVGMAFRDSWKSPGGKILNRETNEDDVYLFESTNNAEFDVLTGVPNRGGPVLERITDKFKSYSNHRYVWIPLRNYSGRTLDNQEVMRYIQEFNRHTFNGDVGTWIMAVLYGDEPPVGGGKFCSQTVSELYNVLGVTNDTGKSHQKIPSDFYWGKLNLSNDWFLGRKQTFTFV